MYTIELDGNDVAYIHKKFSGREKIRIVEEKTKRTFNEINVLRDDYDLVILSKDRLSPVFRFDGYFKKKDLAGRFPIILGGKKNLFIAHVYKIAYFGDRKSSQMLLIPKKTLSSYGYLALASTLLLLTFVLPAISEYLH